MRHRLLALAGIILAGLTLSATLLPDTLKPTFGAWGIDLTGMDSSVQPGDDFYTYVNGVWDTKAVIPPDRSNIGSFSELQILSERRMRDMVGELEAKPYAQLAAEERKLRFGVGVIGGVFDVGEVGREAGQANPGGSTE